MANQFIGRYRDFDNDVKQSSVDLIPSATATEATALGASFNIWSAGNEGGQYFKDEIIGDTGNASNVVGAQGALRLVLEMVDDVTSKVYKEFIPMPNLQMADDVGTNPAYVVSGGLTMMNSAHAEYVTLKSTLDANWQSPEGNTGTLSRGYIEE